MCAAAAACVRRTNTTGRGQREENGEEALEGWENLGGELHQQPGGGGDHGVVVTDWGEVNNNFTVAP